MNCERSHPDPLFATSPVSPDPKMPPAVVVGLPRSGSTFLSHVLSSLDDWFIFDDLYFYQQVVALKPHAPLLRGELEKLVHYLGWVFRSRIKWEVNFLKTDCTWEDVDRMCEAVLETFRDRPVEWTGLMEEWLTRLARHHGRTRWGYKTPQDFQHMELFTRLFPGIRFIFVMRDPRKMMASFKYVPSEDGFRGQYHPLLYARYWGMAFEAFQRFSAKHKDSILLVQFRDLVATPDAEAQRIARFLDTTCTQEVAAGSVNTSFRGSRRKEITPTEKWICEKVIGSLMVVAGYQPEGSRPRFRDIPDLIATTCRFFCFQVYRIFKWPADRYTMATFLKNLLKGN